MRQATEDAIPQVRPVTTVCDTYLAGHDRVDWRKEGLAMDATLLGARLVLALVFAVAGVAKLTDWAGSRRAIVDFGVPAALAGPLGILLPLAELAIAAALLPTTTAWWGAIGALVLLLIFAAAIGANLARGRKPDCHCFGQLHSASAGWSTLTRNAVLAAPAALVVWEGLDGNVGPSAVAWVGALTAVQLLGLFAAVLVVGLLAVQWWFMFGLFSEDGHLMRWLDAVEETLADAGLALTLSGNGPRQMAALPVGTPAPVFELPNLEGEAVTLESLRSLGKPILLLFTDPECGYCEELLPEVGRWQDELADEFTIALISCDDPEENREMSNEHGLSRVLLEEDWEVSEAYRVSGTPSAVLVEPDGTIGSVLAESAEEIENLVSQMTKGSKERPESG
jgi:methylamine dehydrogenase accessory protein MauD